MKSVSVTTGLYVLFAILSTMANLLAQRLVLRFDHGPIGFVAALLCGTAIGLIIKYLLDKRWIFHDRESGAKAHGRKFSLYALMGVFTTLIFWGTETAFWLIWNTAMAREIGAILGLMVGYFVKYHLDRRFVFKGTLPSHTTAA